MKYTILAICLFATFAAAPVTPAANLLDNSGFELQGVAGWQTSLPPGTSACADASIKRSGKASCRLTIPATAPVSWYSAFRDVAPLKLNASYTISAYVRTEGVRDGAGAYISLALFDRAGKRLSYADSREHLQGTGDWRRLSATIQVGADAAEMRAFLLIHGHGTAWFDDAQVEEASAASDYHPSSADALEQVRLDAQADAAAQWGRSAPRRDGQARVAILDEKFPAGEGCPSDPAVLERAFLGAGYAATRLSAAQLANPMILDAAEIDLLVIPSGDAFPTAAHPALLAYLEHGGALLTTGGYAFDRPLLQFHGNWTTPESLPLGDGPSAALFPADVSAWKTGANHPKQPTLQKAAGPAGGPGIELHTDALDLWDLATLPVVAAKCPEGWTVTRFWARGDAQTQAMEFEWQEDDGSRWSKVLALSTDWKQYTIFPADLTLRADSHTPGRGKKTDQFRPARARRMQFGISAAVAARELPHTVWIADATALVDSAGDLRKPSPRINTRWAMIRDALWPEPEQIGVFDPSFPLRNIARTSAAAGQAIVGEFSLDGPLSGYSAVGMLGLNGHGFGPNRARWIPLLECADRFGRPRGHAGAILHHFAGTFAGSSWAIFGTTDRELFASGSPALEQVLLPTAAHLLHRLYLHDTDTVLVCYRQGEAVTFRTRASNFGRKPRTAEARFVVGPEDVLTRQIELKPGETKAIELTWKPDRFTKDYYAYAAEFWEQGRCIDREENAFVVWNPDVLAKGPTLRKDGTRFLVNGRPQFLMGCQTYWGQNASVTARSPAAFDRDFRQMRDAGLLWTRLFLPFKTEEDKRISDAVVQLAQKHGLVLYHTPNLIHTADPVELAQEQQTAKEIALRYRDVPGLAVDICNEPAFKADDAGLAQRFGGAGKTTGPWNDLDVAAYWRCMAGAERAWEQANASALHGGDPARLTSVGWSQGWGGGRVMKDPMLASLDLDFTDRHYYGPPTKLATELKDLDLRGLGKPLILGECGAKEHPTFRAADPWGMGDDDDSYDARFLYLGHHALGLGAAVISTWHWRDPMEGIFPCGIVHATGVPRPTAFAYRAMAMAFAPLKPKSVTPGVCLLLSDEARMGGGRDAAIRAVHRATDLLVAARVDFTLLPDSQLDHLPATTKAILYPAALNPSDQALDRLKAFVEAGGRLYVAGDIGYDEQRRPMSTERLRRLCGVERIAGGATPLEPIQIKLAGAEAQISDQGRPVLTRWRLGKGEVWFAADLIELESVMKPEHFARYRRFLDAAGVERISVSPDRAELHVFRVPGEDADATVLYNAGPAVTASVGSLSVDLAANGAGYMLVGHDGSLRAVEAQGLVTRDGKAVLQITGHAFIIAEDGVDLARSRSLLILPIQAGAIRLPGALAADSGDVGEIRSGQWHRLASLALKPEGGQLALAVPAEYRREMIRVVAGK